MALKVLAVGNIQSTILKLKFHIVPPSNPIVKLYQLAYPLSIPYVLDLKEAFLYYWKTIKTMKLSSLGDELVFVLLTDWHEKNLKTNSEVPTN